MYAEIVARCCEIETTSAPVCSATRSAVRCRVPVSSDAIVGSGISCTFAYANVQLMPDPTIASEETGTRHRTAERVAEQTGALVVSISQQRATISAYIGRVKDPVGAVPAVLAKTNQDR